MQHNVVIQIDVTNNTLHNGNHARKFTPASKEYIIVTLDENLIQIGEPDYAYTNKRETQRLAKKAN